MSHYEVIFLLMSVASSAVCQDQESNTDYIEEPPPIPNIPDACQKQTYCSDEDFKAAGIENHADWPQWWSDMLNGLKTLSELTPIEWKPSPDSCAEGSDDCEAHDFEVRTIRYVRLNPTADDPWMPAAYSHDYQQQVYIQKCKKEYAPCFKELRVDDGAKACCYQEMTHIVVTVWTSDNEISKETIPLPAYCSCKISSNCSA